MALPEFDSSSEGLGHFFDAIWGENEGYVQVPVKEPLTDSWQKAMFKWPKQRKGIIKFVLAQTAEGKDVYYGPAIYASTESTDKDNIIGAQVLWAEFDGNAQEANYAAFDPGEGTDKGEEGQETGAHAATEGVPEPSLRVQTSTEGRQHHYWRLESFVTDIEKLEEKNRALAYTFQTDKSGWDATQVLRPPYTTNYKKDYDTPLPVKLLSYDERRLSFSSFASLRPTKLLVPDTITIDNLPPVEWVVAKYKWDEKHFDLLIKGAEEGGRSDALMRLGYFGAEAGMTNEEIYALLQNADDRWGKFKNRTNRQRILLDYINRARQKHPVGIDSPEALVFSGLQQSPIQQSPRIVYGYEDFLNTKIHIEWAVEGLLEVAGHGMITGPPGVGKTQFLLDKLTHLAMGEDFLGWKVLGRNRILFLSLEMNHAALKLFTETQAQSRTPAEISLLQRNFQIAPLGMPIPFDAAEGRKFIEALIQEYQPTILAIDSLGKTTSKPLEESTVKILNQYFVHLRQKYGCSLLFVHHNRKANGDNKKPKELGDLYGSQYIAAEASSVIGLWREEKNVVEVSLLKSRLAEEVDPFLIKRAEHLHFERKEQAIGGGLIGDTKPEKEKTTDEPKRDVKPSPNESYGNGTFGFNFG